jgi:predicted transcriptional regulator
MVGWYSLDLTKSERAVLDAIWAAPEKSVGYTDLFRVAGKTARGARIVLNRMVDRSLLARSEGCFSQLTITFKGMQALGVTAKARAA